MDIKLKDKKDNPALLTGLQLFASYPFILFAVK